uniref:DUF4880 domain-containing protein n=1 Tax=Pseudomonas sp. RW407 TaxID=2202894 RepID=UPI0013143F6B|nr:DUF4880 domain-containing protein [Pseudomonas sp. RW407]
MSASGSSALLEAIDWYARQASGTFSIEEHQHFLRWLAESPQHKAAWGQLEQRLAQTLAPLAGTPARGALQVSSQQRRSLLRGALCLGGLALGGRLLSEPGFPLAGLRSDLSTGTAQRSTFILPDGSSLLLNAQSAVDLDFSNGQRRVRLIDGGLLVDVVRAQTPLELGCRYGSAQLVSGRCMLMLQKTEAQLFLLAGHATVLGRSGERMALDAGQSIRLTDQGILPSELAGDPQAWTRGLLEVHHQSLASVIDALRPYHHGSIRLAPEVAELRISGLFYLDDSDQALAALSDVLPIRIERYLGWWTRIVPA